MFDYWRGVSRSGWSVGGGGGVVLTIGGRLVGRVGRRRGERGVVLEGLSWCFACWEGVLVAERGVWVVF